MQVGNGSRLARHAAWNAGKTTEHRVGHVIDFARAAVILVARGFSCDEG